MVTRSILLCLLVLGVLAGCSDSRKTADKDFREAYEKNFVPSCVSSAMQSGVAEEKARQKCTCLARYLTGNYSPEKLAGIGAQESPEAKKMVDAAFAACK